MYTNQSFKGFSALRTVQHKNIYNKTRTIPIKQVAMHTEMLHFGYHYLGTFQNYYNCEDRLVSMAKQELQA